jgi:hypothetical protein
MRDGWIKTRTDGPRSRWPGPWDDARRLALIAWRRSREPALRGARPIAARSAWAFVGWIALVGLAYALARGRG